MSAVLVEDGPDKGAIWHFGEPVKEQRALEAGTAWADLSHLDIVAIKGADRLTWLHALTTQHHEQLQPGQWQEALILDPQGHVEYQFLVVDDGDTVFLVLDPGYKQTLIEYLNKIAPVRALKWHNELYVAARHHVNDIGPRGLVQHESSDSTSVKERLKKYGKIVTCYGENLSFHSETALEVLLQ